MKKWNDLPSGLKTSAVRPYYDILKKRAVTRALKKLFDIVAATVLTLLLSPVMFLLAILIRCESPGPAIYKSRRITRYGRPFTIYKFRTMSYKKEGSSLTVSGDERITRIGKKLRPLRLDELPQLFNVLKGEMSFVGPRPEAEKYVEHYRDDMAATLLLPAGITSPASLAYKNEAIMLKEYLSKGIPPDEAYISFILPEKTKLDLSYIKNISFFSDIAVCIKTLISK